MGHAAETVGLSANCFVTTLQIYNTGQVQSDAAIPWPVRLTGGAGMVVGILLGGWRLVPVVGMLHEGNTPCCSHMRGSMPLHHVNPASKWFIR